MAKIFLKGFNSCVMRNKELLHYRIFLKANGHAVTEIPEEASHIILWSCAFRHDVAANSIREAASYQSRFPGAEIILCGCLPDIIDSMVPPDFRGKVISWSGTAAFLEKEFGGTASFDSLEPVFTQQALCRDAAEYRRLHPESNAMFHDQFVKLLVSEGCPFHCAYCSEILTLPPHRSVPPEKLAAALRGQLRPEGGQSVILLSDCLGEYGSDIGTSLPDLIRRLAALFPGTEFALHNLHPASIIKRFDAVISLVKDGLIAHINLPIQSASDRVLAAMERNYTRKDLGRIMDAFAACGFTKFDTHIIAGFPGETDTDFRETVDFILEHRIRYVLASSFFCVPKTPAAAMPGQVPDQVKAARCALAKSAFESAGIICNIENSGLAKERLRRINTDRKA